MGRSYKKLLESVLEEIGVKKGQNLLDFGCGSGHYTIPAAEVVGKDGNVYAVDKNKSRLAELNEKAEDMALKNINIVSTSGGTDLPFAKESMDVILLYDVFWYFDLYSKGLTKLLDEVYRISRRRGLLSVYPKHIDSAGLRQKIKQAGFSFKSSYSGTLIHDGRPESGTLINFDRD